MPTQAPSIDFCFLSSANIPILMLRMHNVTSAHLLCFLFKKIFLQMKLSTSKCFIKLHKSFHLLCQNIAIEVEKYHWKMLREIKCIQFKPPNINQ